jgi:cyclophilin family peptidyl-prolyl cis-trans isomerase
MRGVRPLVFSLLLLGACDSDGDGTSGTDGSTSAQMTSTTGTVDPSTTGPNTTTATTMTSAQSTGDEVSTSSPVIEDLGGGASTSSTTGEPTGLVVMETTLGTITIELFSKQAPITVENFIAYIDTGFYDGTDGMGATIFHRVIPGFVIQGGGLVESLDGKTTMPPIVNEHDMSGLLNDRGTLSMARTTDPNSATSQFFINLVDNDGLDMSPGYAVFAQVVEGMDVVDAIAAVATTDVPPFADVPVDPITITSVTLE